MSATACSVSRNSRDAAAILVFAMNWLGVSPKNRFINRANRCGASRARCASFDGVIGAATSLSNSCSAAANPTGISLVAIGARTSREMPIKPTMAPAASRSGSFVVRHQPGWCGRYQCNSR